MPKASSRRGDICGSRKTIPLGFGGTTASVGDHICHFYRGEAERFGVLGPYVAEGIRRGDKVLVVTDEEMADRLGDWLASQGIDAPRAIKAGQLLQHPGEASKEDMRALFERVEADSLAAGSICIVGPKIKNNREAQQFSQQLLENGKTIKIVNPVSSSSEFKNRVEVIIQNNNFFDYAYYNN